MTDRTVDLAELEAFLAVAAELHFGRAAVRLRVSQPRTSQLVRSLERRVGGRLFDRTSRRVTPTPLGVRLQELTEPLVDGLRDALGEVRALARELRVGFLGGFSSVLDRATVAYQARHPEWAVSLVEITWPDLYGPLRRGEIDLQVSVWPVEQPDLVTGPVIAEFPRMLAIAARHPLARRPELSVEDLAALTIIQPADGVPEELKRSYWPPPVTPSGRPIRPGPGARTQQEMLNLVALDAGVYVTSTITARHYTHPAVVFVPFTGMSPTRAVLSWRADTVNDRVPEFAALAADSGSRSSP